MASLAQMHANRINAQRSTGPTTPEGKAAVAQNRTSHGFTGAFRVLPSEDGNAYRQLLHDYTDEYDPSTPTERFLVAELAQAQWRIMRADAIEAELLSPGDNPTYADIAATFRDSDALTRLGRYAQAARRAYYKAMEKLQALQHESSTRAARDEDREYERRVAAYIDAPPPTPDRPVAVPMPPALERELDELLERNPCFDPRDTSQMSERLRKWFDGIATLTA